MRLKFGWRPLVAMPLMAFWLAPEIAVSAEVADIVPDYASYGPAPFLAVDGGEVRIQPVADWASRIVIVAPEAAGASVRLTAEGYRLMRLRELRSGERVISRKGEAMVPIDEDGIGWFAFYHDPPDISVVDYKPKILLNVPDTTPQRAKYPVVDVHTHISWRDAKLRQRLRVMDETGVAIAMDSPLAIAGQSTEEGFGMFEANRPERFVTLSTIDFTRRHEEGFADGAIAALRSDVEKMNVMGIGETHDKGAGVFGNAMRPEAKGPVYIDDERLMPIWREAAWLNLPILFHTSDPLTFFEPPDRHAVNLVRQIRSPWFGLSGLEVLSSNDIRLRRNRLLEEIPELVIVAAHMDNVSIDLERLAEDLRRYPNLQTEIGVRHHQLARQPRVARKFMIEFQDRVLFGADGAQSAATYRMHWRIFETDDDSFMAPNNHPDPYYYYGLDLPDVVLKKLYYANAARIYPRIKSMLLELHPGLDFPE